MLVKFENKLDTVISHFDFKLVHIEKFKFTLTFGSADN